MVQAFWKYTSFSYHKNAFIYCMVSALYYLRVKLYDHRIIQRGAVQTYEAHVNSHTRLQLGVDPSERFFISGGEDCKLRLWSIKSGELFFEDKLTNTVIPTVCWQKAEAFKGLQDERQKAMTMLNMIAWGLGLDRQKEYFTCIGNFECQYCGRVLQKFLTNMPRA